MRPALAKLGLWASLLVGSSALAQPQRTAAFEDTMAQRLLACTLCHGRDGQAAADGYRPRLAGKPEKYLYNQLVNFQQGRRHNALMQGLLEPLSDAYLQDIAKHFATLNLPYPPPQPSTANAAELQRGERLVRTGDAARGLPACVACHGQALTGMLPATPGLLGLPRDYLNAQLGAWKLKQRKALAPDCMADIAAKLEREDIAALSQWLASQALPAHTGPASASTAAAPIRCGTVPDRAAP